MLLAEVWVSGGEVGPREAETQGITVRTGREQDLVTRSVCGARRGRRGWFSGLSGLGDGRWRNRAGFGLGHVGFKMPEEHLGGAVWKAQLNVCVWSAKERSV